MTLDISSIDTSSGYFIAEAGVNHDGDIAVAKRLIEVAAEAGADAVKFQTFTTDRLVTEEARKAEYATETTTKDQTQREMLREYELSEADHRTLQEHSREHDITFLSTPFDKGSADLLYDLDVPAIKIGSGELNNRPLLEYIAELGKPMIVSTGMATLTEVKDAHGWITDVSPDLEVAFLHCTSEYPAKVRDINLRAMQTMSDELPTPIGYSDHTTAVEVPGFAVAAGANIVEKHFTLDSSRPGPDHEASLEPSELREAVRIAKLAAEANGSPEKLPTDTEIENRKASRKSLHAGTRINEGERFTKANIDIKRPANGLPPLEIRTVTGKKSRTDLEPGDPIIDDVVED